MFSPLSRASLTSSFRLAAQALRQWESRTWMVAAVSGVAVALVIGAATVLIPNPVFGRDIAPVWWNYPVWIVTSALSGMLLATYLRGGSETTSDAQADRSGKFGLAGTVIAWFAVGCPVCNKIALLALGYSGALTWFAPLQPVLALAALGLTGAALVARLRGEIVCAMPRRPQEVAA